MDNVTLPPLAPSSVDTRCPMFANVERDISLGESTSGNSVILTREHVNRLREMMANKEKLKRFLCSSINEQEVSANFRKINGRGADRIVIPTPEKEKKGIFIFNKVFVYICFNITICLSIKIQINLS